MKNAHIFAEKLGEKSVVELQGKEKEVVTLISAIIRSFAYKKRMSFRETLKTLERVERHELLIKANIWEGNNA